MSEENKPVNTSVPLDLHPDVANTYDLPDDHPVAQQAKGLIASSLKTAHGTLTAINEVEAALMANRLPNQGEYRAPDGTMKPLTGHEDKMSEQVVKAVDRATNTLASRVAQLSAMGAGLAADIESRIRDPRQTDTQAAEIRAHVKTLGKGDQFDFISKAALKGDLRTLSAVINGPHYLSGLTSDTHEQVRDLAARALCPVESRVLDSITKATSKLMHGSAALSKRCDEVTAVSRARAARVAASLEKLK